MHSELRNSFEYASGVSPLGELDRWTNALPSSLDQVLKIEKEATNAACQMTKEHTSDHERCHCGAVKTLIFKWESYPIQYPFFGGCVKYTWQSRVENKHCGNQIPR